MRTRSWLRALLLAAASASFAAHGQMPGTTAAVRAEARHVALEDAGRRSNDLRLRVLFSRPLTDAAATAARDETPLAALLEGARGSTDPLVLQLLLDRCRLAGAAASCDPVDLARRWVAADAQDATGWLELAALLDRAGDAPAADDAFTHASRASTFRDPTDRIARVLWSAMPKSSDARDRVLDLTYVIGVAVAVPQLWLQDATNACRQAARRARCAALADLASRDADSLAGVMLASALTTQADEADWLQRSRRQTAEAYYWAGTHAAPGDDVQAAAPDADDAAIEAHAARLQRHVEIGDVAVARDELRTLGLSVPEAAQRYALARSASMGRPPPAH